MERMNRRDIIKGATATAALATASTANAAQNATELTRLMLPWEKLDAEIRTEGRAVDDFERALLNSAPLPPAILFQAVAVPQGSPLSPSNGADGWTVDALDGFLKTGTYPVIEKYNIANGHTVTWLDLPLPLDAIEALQAIKAARLDRDAAKAAHFADHASPQDEWEGKVSEQDDVLQQIVDYRPASWPELHLKADWLRSSGALKRAQECSDDVGLLEALACDILNLPIAA